TATSASRRGSPVPSITVPLRITKSYVTARPSELECPHRCTFRATFHRFETGRLSAGEDSVRLRARALRLAVASALMVAPLAATVVFASSAGAAPMTFHVTNTDDAGDGSLRKALADAAANVGDDTVQVDVTGTITLTTTPIVWNGNGSVTINGN